MTRFVAILLALFHLLMPLGSCTPLDDYVNRPDSSYKYEIVSTVIRGGIITQYYVNMTSQTWLDSDLVSQSIWYHYLIVNVPHQLDSDNYATLHIAGGNNGYELPTKNDQDVQIGMLLSLDTNLITASLKMIPNQPIKFSEDPDKKNRDESALIAYTWRHFLLNTSNPEYLAYLPMTKAVVRALDTITHLINKQKGLSIKRFGVVGASKRGWTTWTAALVDTRIIAISPIVLDLLNLSPLLHHMYRAYNGWSFAFRDYTQANVTELIDSKEFEVMMEIIDPYNYFKRLERSNISVFLINTCGDEFMMPDDNFYFWDKLPAPKYLKMIPNAEHSDTGHILATVMDVGTFFLSVINNYKLPQTNWTFENAGNIARINFWTDTDPVEVVLWHATTLPENPKRDFRLFAGPDPNYPTPQLILWRKKETTVVGKHSYMGEVNQPEVGWTGCFIEATYSFKINGEIRVFQITSQVNIIPNTFPYPDCRGAGCKGKLV